jgi:hypothetical protein
MLCVIYAQCHVRPLCCVSFMLKFIYTAFMLIVIMLSFVTLVEHSPHHPKVMSSCTAPAARPGKKKRKKIPSHFSNQ